MTHAYLITLSEEKKRYLINLLEADEREEFQKISRDILLTISGLVGIEEAVIEKHEHLPAKKWVKEGKDCLVFTGPKDTPAYQQLIRDGWSEEPGVNSGVVLTRPIKTPVA